MKIVWNEPKRIKNIDKHGLDFSDLNTEFFSDALLIEARKGRVKAVGILVDDVVAVIFAILGSEGISLISLRRASRKERSLYERKFEKAPGPH